MNNSARKVWLMWRKRVTSLMSQKPFKLLKWTLKTKVIMVVMAAVLVTTAVIVAISQYIMKRDIKALISDQQYAAVSMIASAVDESFQSRRIALEVLSQGVARSSLRDSDSLQNYLRLHYSMADLFFNFSVFSADGTLLANYINADLIGRMNVAQQTYMRQTLTEKRSIISAPLRSLMSSRAVVLMTQPVFDGEGNVIMVFVGAIDLQQANFLRQFTDTRVGKQGFVFILTANGVVVDHLDKSRILQHVDQAGGRLRSTDLALAGFEGTMEGVNRIGQPALLAYKRIHSTDWIIGSIYLQEDAFAPVREIQQKALWLSLSLALLAGVLAWLIMARLIDPLHHLHRHIQKIRATKTNEEVPLSYRQDEIGDLGNAFNALMRERKHAEMELDQALVNLEGMNKTLKRLALEDDLTGLANRRRFDLALQEEFGRAIRHSQSLALVMIDVDHFKQYNDIYGHLAGDQCLHKVGRVIRAQQTRPGDLMARYGGEEVAILLPAADEEGAMVVAERVRMAVRQLVLLHEGNEAGIVTISAGVAAMVPRRDVDVPDQLLRAADQALYLAKQQGRDRTCSSSDLVEQA